MHEAMEYAELFKTGQVEKLYFVSGRTKGCAPFRIFILPKNEKGIYNGPVKPPKNKNAIEVYGALGLNKPCGWLYHGPWIEDFLRLVRTRREEEENALIEKQNQIKRKEKEEEERIMKLLEDY